MTIGCFFAVCRNSNSSHSLGHVQFDHHLGGILILLPTGVLKDVEVLGFYDVKRLVGFDPVLCLLALRRLQEIDWSRHGGENPPYLGCDLKTRQAFDILPLCVNKRSKTDSGATSDVLCHEM